MEELLVIALGALAVIAAPLVPGVRPLAKSAVKGGMALGSAAAAAAVAAGQQWDHLADKVGSKTSEAHLPVIESTATAVVESVQTTSESAAAKVGDAAAAASESVSHALSAATAAAVEMAEETADVPTTDAAVDVVEEPAVDTAAAESAVPVSATGDDLTKISGIGAKTAGVLAAAGITTYAQLAAATEAGLREILDSAGSRYRLLDPTTWPDQAGKLIAEQSAQ